uniref:Uncharacterized protein n=1 Tax=Utricularia reniformis TaxID=192314 RepID=A0A1Y0B1G3_9LAMI|nr:hypothetical protein AEK19_MT1028 [Utricularia reniformis]ART31250.1 hypothetical protein AEK19_MT1028 [Utricularia reniformis]
MSTFQQIVFNTLIKTSTILFPSLETYSRNAKRRLNILGGSMFVVNSKWVFRDKTPVAS